MAYDSARGVTVLFGGSVYGGQRSDTWEYRAFPAADLNRDRYIDEHDLQIFEDCATGPGVPYYPTGLPPDCDLVLDSNHHIAADLDQDGDVDQSDFGILQRCLNGIEPADPNCTK